jgi:hypothetical protein
MNTVKSLQIVAISVLVSSTVWASSDDKDNASEVNMMNDANGSMMMSPEMMSRQRVGMQQMMDMMDMQMMQKMMQQMNAMGQPDGHGHGQGSSMMGGGMGGMKMNPQMMQMRMEHMTNMEQHLANIESLLSQLVELQKAQ